jgi:hypothetical protein
MSNILPEQAGAELRRDRALTETLEHTPTPYLSIAGDVPLALAQGGGGFAVEDLRSRIGFDPPRQGTMRALVATCAADGLIKSIVPTRKDQVVTAGICYSGRYRKVGRRQIPLACGFLGGARTGWVGLAGNIATTFELGETVPVIVFRGTSSRGLSGCPMNPRDYGQKTHFCADFRPIN